MVECSGQSRRVNVYVDMEPDTGRVLAYASTDPEGFPATKAYPAASLVKVITAAAALDAAPGTANLPCRYKGSPYRLTPARIDPPRDGKTVSLTIEMDGYLPRTIDDVSIEQDINVGDIELYKKA